jgi:hypothetical protein
MYNTPKAGRLHLERAVEFNCFGAGNHADNYMCMWSSRPDRSEVYTLYTSRPSRLSSMTARLHAIRVQIPLGSQETKSHPDELHTAKF